MSERLVKTPNRLPLSGYAWIVLAVALLGIVVWSMPSANPEAEKAKQAKKAEAAAAKWVFPEQANADDLARASSRKLLPDGQAKAPNGTTRTRDPLIAALPPQSEAVVVETSALFSTRVGRMLESCYNFSSLLGAADIKLTDYERIAIANMDAHERLILLSGPITHRLDALDGRANPVVRGENGRIFSPPAPPTTTPASAAKAARDPSARAALTVKPELAPAAAYLGTWKSDLVLFSSSLPQVERALDRVDGRSVVASFLPDSEVYGAMFGEVLLSRLTRVTPAPLQQQVEQSKLRVRFHVRASDQLLISGRIFGALGASDLGQQLAARIDDMHRGARIAGDKRFDQLMESFVVVPGQGEFTLNIALTPEILEAALGKCAAELAPAAPVIPKAAANAADPGKP